MPRSEPPTPLRELRAAKGLGLRETARRAGMNPGLLSAIERGDRIARPHHLERLQEVLDLPRPLELIVLPVMR